MANSGSVKRTDYEPGKWSVSAEVLMPDGNTEWRVMPDYLADSLEAQELVEHINGPQVARDNVSA